jgi:type II secretory pathway pseudopilin PulG
VEIIVTSVVAVVGTLLGSLATHYFQRRNRADAERFERNERLRQERVSAYTAFGGALINLRRTSKDRWYAIHDHRDGADPETLRYETYRLFTTAQESLFRVELITESRDLIELGRQALTDVDRIKPDLAREDFARHREVSRKSVFAFMDAARKHVDVA